MAKDSFDIGLATFENHMRFLDTHRGDVTRDAEGIWARSKAEGFTSWTPAGEASPIPPRCPAVRLAPWSGPAWETKLRGQGFSPDGTLTYMKLADAHRPISQSVDIAITRARDEAGARLFADVQAAGFATGYDAADTWWQDYFTDMAVWNVRDSGQDFYIGLLDGVAAGCTLVIHHAGVAGVYAVATRPEFRNRGVSSALLEQVRKDALALHEPVILGAMKGSYAEGYYARLGFETLYELTVWRREEENS